MRWSAAEALAWIIRQAPLKLKEWTHDMGPEIEAAGRTLAKAIGDEKVGAWGRPKPHALTEQIPSDQFRLSGLRLIVGLHGDLVTSPPHKLSIFTGTQWHDIQFEADEIKRAFPKPAPIFAVQWMLKEAQRYAAAGRFGKRDDMVRDCRAQINCTKRQAEAAHRKLPEHLKRKQGKPPKNSG